MEVFHDIGATRTSLRLKSSAVRLFAPKLRQANSIQITHNWHIGREIQQLLGQ